MTDSLTKTRTLQRVRSAGERWYEVVTTLWDQNRVRITAEVTKLAPTSFQVGFMIRDRNDRIWQRPWAFDIYHSTTQYGTPNTGAALTSGGAFTKGAGSAYGFEGWRVITSGSGQATYTFTIPIVSHYLHWGFDGFEASDLLVP